MKKRIVISVMIIVALALILFLPIPKDSYDDGGTREYSALTYKIVVWNRNYIFEEEAGQLKSDTYKNTVVYWYPDNQKSIDELWRMEKVRLAIQTPDGLLSVPMRVWDRHHSNNAQSDFTSAAVRTPDLDNALLEYKEDGKFYIDGEYLLGDTGCACESFYLSDLTGDGRPELCFGMSVGSGFVSSEIEIIDFTTRNSLFSLSDRVAHDYYLFLRDNVLCVKETDRDKQETIRTGVLEYKGAEISVAWDAEVNDRTDP